MNSALLELSRHKTWATLRLIEHCQALGDDTQLDAIVAGSYGTIRDTLHHLVDADEDYFWMLTGQRLSEPLGDKRVPLRELAERIRRLAPGWEVLAEDDDLGAREATADDGVRMPGTVPMAQAIHHADDHRTHVLSILGARGLEVPHLDVWGYATSQNQLLEPQAPTGD